MEPLLPPKYLQSPAFLLLASESIGRLDKSRRGHFLSRCQRHGHIRNISQRHLLSSCKVWHNKSGQFWPRMKSPTMFLLTPFLLASSFTNSLNVASFPPSTGQWAQTELKLNKQSWWELGTLSSRLCFIKLYNFNPVSILALKSIQKTLLVAPLNLRGPTVLPVWPHFHPI